MCKIKDNLANQELNKIKEAEDRARKNGAENLFTFKSPVSGKYYSF